MSYHSLHCRVVINRIRAAAGHSGDQPSPFVAQLEAVLHFFSSEDKIASNAYSSSFSQSSYDTTRLSTFSDQNRSGSPDGSGWFVTASAGWIFQFDKVLVAVAWLGNAQWTSFDYVLASERVDSSDQPSNRGVSRIPLTMQRESFAHDVSILNMTIAIPVGFEVELMENFFLRTGWSPRFVRSVRKDLSDDAGYRNATSLLDVARVTFGIGFELFDRLKVSMLNLDSITTPRDWQVAAQYEL